MVNKIFKKTEYINSTIFHLSFLFSDFRLSKSSEAFTREINHSVPFVFQTLLAHKIPIIKPIRPNAIARIRKPMVGFL